MQAIDRVVAIIKPSEIMLQWINTEVMDPDEQLELEDIQVDCTVLLLPIFATEEEAEEYFSQIYEDIFVNELSAWNLDEHTWPEDRSLENFLDWFEIEFYSTVYDCGNTSLVSQIKSDHLLQ